MLRVNFPWETEAGSEREFSVAARGRPEDLDFPLGFEILWFWTNRCPSPSLRILLRDEDPYLLGRVWGLRARTSVSPGA